jgi:F0F1-type ATP synthase assembly protein I
VPQVDRLSQNATAEAQKVVDRAFRLGLVLIAVLLIGAVLASLVYRFFAEKLKRPAH